MQIIASAATDQRPAPYLPHPPLIPMKRLLKSSLRTLGYDLVPHTPPGHIDFSTVPDLTDEQRAIITKVRPFTMTSLARMASLINAVDYVAKNRIPGDIAECGVWRGGSMMVIALTLLAHGDRSRSLYLYDTYEGMSEPTSRRQKPRWRLRR